ncbi:secretion protein F [Rhodococcus triatomae]|uniref:Tight adherence protein B n=1 Tax=Rhodococcus triatomae TaxID=300028 RepID=A0A1G8IKW6_9NOCA|nr:type II secretion system F family protein [Rhodococcus triatomae]QNG21081.1 secretion protein F [Rhodococcus triatomae]QNG23005.1 secretion protein F [Rhodococcus triatomae]SDI19482.1 tight adherence protein B [Rhodococcus triatomae]
MTTTVVVPLLLLGAALALLPPAGALRRIRTRTASRSVRATGAAGRRPVAVAAIAALATVLIVVSGSVAVVVAALLVGATAHGRIARARADRERIAQVAAVQAGLDTLAAELTVGAHPAAACAAAADECAPPVAEVFRTAAARARLGGSAAQGFRGARGPAAEAFERIAAVWLVADRHGLALAELLQAVRADLQGRARFRRRTEAGLAGARATAAVLAGLPVVGVGLGQLMGASPWRVLLGGGVGGVLLVVGSALACAGLFWTDRITRRVVS